MTKRKHLIMTLLSLACAEQADARDRPLAAPTPPFDVATFFLGKTEGEGRLKVVTASPLSTPSRMGSDGVTCVVSSLTLCGWVG